MSYDLEDFVNTEQMLELGFEILVDDDESEIAQQIIGWYAVQSDPTIFEDENVDRYIAAVNCLIAQAVLRDLVEIGMLTFDFESQRYFKSRFAKKMLREC
ncbi:MAG: hypothetical protein SGI77_12820 [Pirellulaceae bacterium]|nr:hypothetical protein [Pirellulaceae bacterium]